MSSATRSTQTPITIDITEAQAESWQRTHEHRIERGLRWQIIRGRVMLFFIEPLATIERTLEWFVHRSIVELVLLGAAFPASVATLMGFLWLLAATVHVWASFVAIATVACWFLALIKLIRKW